MILFHRVRPTNDPLLPSYLQEPLQRVESLKLRQSRSNVFRSLFGSIIAFTILCAGLYASEPFTLIVLPDTQNYTTNHPSHNAAFIRQTEWIVENREDLNIVFVIHEGDLVASNSSDGQWGVAREAMLLLEEAGIPYAVAPGNHDYGSGRDLTKLNQYFPLSIFQAFSTFGGFFPEEPNSSANTYHTFNAGGNSFLVFALEFGPRTAVMAWVNDVIDAHPQHRVWMVTHSYLDKFGQRTNRDTPKNARYYGLGPDTATGDSIWEYMIYSHANFDFVFCGHDGGSPVPDGDPAAMLVSQTQTGNNVYQFIINWQYSPWNSPWEGALRIMTFDPATKSMSVSSYSPYHNAWIGNDRNQFAVTNLNYLGSGTTPEGLELNPIGNRETKAEQTLSFQISSDHPDESSLDYSASGIDPQ